MVLDNDVINNPPIVWAQRTNTVYLTVCLEDCTSPIIEIQPESVHFKGVGGTEKKEYEVMIPLYKEIDPEKSEKFVRARNIEIILKKKEEGRPYWRQLTKEKKKYHWLKIDFSKWKDEEDSDDELKGQPEDLEEMMRSMGGLGAPKADFDIDAPESDSDDEIPDLQ